MDKDQLAALDRAAIESEAAWNVFGQVLISVFRTGKLILIDDGAVERCVKAMRALAEREGWIDHVHPDDQAEQDASFAQLTTAVLAALTGRV